MLYHSGNWELVWRMDGCSIGELFFWEFEGVGLGGMYNIVSWESGEGRGSVIFLAYIEGNEYTFYFVVLLFWISGGVSSVLFGSLSTMKDQPGAVGGVVWCWLRYHSSRERRGWEWFPR